MQVPTEGAKLVVYNRLKQFMVARVRGLSFCPVTNERYDSSANLGPYITNDSDFQFAVVNASKCALRVAGNKLGPGEEIHAAVGRQVQRVEGRELMNQASFGPEPSLYANSFAAGLKMFPDLRELFGPLYNTADILKKLGVHSEVPGIANEDGADAPPLFTAVQFKTTATDVATVAVGVHCMALIALVSLAGGISYHPSVSANIAQSAIGLLLREFPKSFTPNNMTKILNFDPDTVLPRNIRVEPTERPAYLPRPVNDPSFMVSGIFTLAPVIMTKNPIDSIGDDVVFGLLPEHCTHNSGLVQYASLFNCNITELPVSELEVRDFDVLTCIS